MNLRTLTCSISRCMSVVSMASNGGTRNPRALGETRRSCCRRRAPTARYAGRGSRYENHGTGSSSHVCVVDGSLGHTSGNFGTFRRRWYPTAPTRCLLSSCTGSHARTHAPRHIHRRYATNPRNFAAEQQQKQRGEWRRASRRCQQEPPGPATTLLCSERERARSPKRLYFMRLHVAAVAVLAVVLKVEWAVHPRSVAGVTSKPPAGAGAALPIVEAV